MRYFTLVSVLALAGAPLFGAEAPRDPETAKVMQGVFQSLQDLLPLSLKANQFSAPANRELILKNLDALAAGAEALESHVGTHDAGMRRLGLYLKADITRAREWFAANNTDEARYYLHNITENCIACHSKLPAARNFPAATGFFANAEVEKLPPAEKVWFQVATRRFDDALATYRTVLLDSRLNFEALARLGVFRDYLKIALRVKEDFGHPRELFETLKKRNDQPKASRLALDEALKALKQVEAQAQKGGDPLAAARDMLKKGLSGKRRVPTAPEAIYLTVATGRLHRWLDAGQPSPEALAEVYYLLGQAEARVGQSFWISEAHSYWEEAVRIAPESQWAGRALDAFKESMSVRLSGGKEKFLAEDAKGLVSELEDLRKNAKSAPRATPGTTPPAPVVK